MDFAHAPRVTLLQAQMRRFLDDLVLPANVQWQRYAAAGVYPLDVLYPLKRQAQSLGLWNLFLPGLREHEPGARLANLDYAPLAKIMGPGRVHHCMRSIGQCELALELMSASASAKSISTVQAQVACCVIRRHMQRQRGVGIGGSFSRASMIATPCMKNAPGPKQGAARWSPGLRAQG